jgi:hypothetical protein
MHRTSPSDAKSTDCPLREIHTVSPACDRDGGNRLLRKDFEKLSKSLDGKSRSQIFWSFPKMLESFTFS